MVGGHSVLSLTASASFTCRQQWVSRCHMSGWPLLKAHSFPVQHVAIKLEHSFCSCFTHKCDAFFHRNSAFITHYGLNFCTWRCDNKTKHTFLFPSQFLDRLVIGDLSNLSLRFLFIENFSHFLIRKALRSFCFVFVDLNCQHHYSCFWASLLSKRIT